MERADAAILDELRAGPRTLRELIWREPGSRPARYVLGEGP